jgi:hypothetical protein
VCRRRWTGSALISTCWLCQVEGTGA